MAVLDVTWALVRQLRRPGVYAAIGLGAKRATPSRCGGHGLYLAA